ncbi:DNA-3-methyladenine glycosylase, partial [Limosilactobacillus coleohominis]
CFDVVVQKAGEPQGILIRAIEPTINVQQMIKNRGVQGVNISNGPGKLMQALGIQSRQMDGQSMSDALLSIDITSKTKPQNIATSLRIGINPAGANYQAPLRFYVAQNPYVSKMLKRDADEENHGWEM